MIRHDCILYGAAIRSDIPLFPDAVCHWPSNDAKFGTLSLSRTARPDSPIGARADLFNSHGQILWIQSSATALNERTTGDRWVLHVGDLLSFEWVTDDPAIRYAAGDHVDTARIRFWFAHIALPVYLSLMQRRTFFHAAAVAVTEDCAVLLVAPSMGGKSTLANQCQKQGLRLLTDDKAAICAEGQRYLVLPGHPRHRPWRAQEDIGQPIAGYRSTPAQLAAIYLLESSPGMDQNHFRPVHGIEAFNRVFPTMLYPVREAVTARFTTLGHLLNTVPIFELQRPWNLDRVADTVSALLEHQSTRVAG